MRLSVKLYILAVITLIFALGTVYFVSINPLRNFLIELRIKEQSHITRDATDILDRFLYERYLDIQGFDSGPIFRMFISGKATRDEAMSRVNNFSVSSGPWSSLDVIDINGKIILSTDEEVIGKNVKEDTDDLTAFKKSLEGDIYYSDVVVCERNNNLTIIYSAPIKKDDSFGSPIIGAVVGHFYWPAAVEILERYREPDFQLYNSQGILIGCNGNCSKDVLKKDNLGRLEFLKNIKEQNYSESGNSFENGYESLLSYSKESGYLDYRGNNWILVADLPVATAFGEINRVTYNISLLVLIFILAWATTLFFYLKQYLIQPIVKLDNIADKIGKGDLSARVEISTKDEIGSLTASFNKMTDSLVEANRGLEKKVKERTEELLSKNKLLEESENKYSSLIETTDTGYVIIDVQGKVLDANKEYIRLSGHKELKDILGKSVIEWTAKHHLDKNAEAVKLCAKQGFIRNLQIDYVDETGKKFTPIEINASVITLKDKPIILTLCRDITGRLIAEQRLLEEKNKVTKKAEELQSKIVDLNEARAAILNVAEDTEREKEKFALERDRLDIILHSIGDGVFVVDENLKIIICNEVTENISGFNQKELVGKKYDDVLKFVFEKDGGINDKFISEAMATGQVKEMANHTSLIRKDGSRLAVADSAAPLKSKDGKVIGCVVVFRDVTKERAIDRAKTEFVSLASHQLRTPLSIVKWYSEILLKNREKDLSEKEIKYINEVYKGNQRMIDLVNALLNVSRIEMGSIAIEPTSINLIELVDDIFKDFKFKLGVKKIKLGKKYSDNLPDINADPQIMRMIIQNLISNAIKYTLDKGKINLEINEIKKDFVIKVTDNGIGIPLAQQSKIFSKLFRADNAREFDPDGNGLGLYIVKSIVDSAGGKIWFESKEKEGTTFYVSIPAKGMEKKEGVKGLVL